MPAVAAEEIIRAIANAIADSGYAAQVTTPPGQNPRHFVITGAPGLFALSVYAWTLTFGGRKSLRDEYRIQMTSVRPPLARAKDGPTILLGYDSAANLFAGFDIDRHRNFTAGSSSVQIDIRALHRAERDGLSFHEKANGEIAVGIRPDLLIAYARNSSALHRIGGRAGIADMLGRAVEAPEAGTPEISTSRNRVVSEISRLSRDAAFRRRVLFAYGSRCAVTRVQLQLIDAAHILPVGADGSTDHVRNGIALSPTYHRAFDAGLIYLDEGYRMRLDENKLGVLRDLNLARGISAFRQPLGPVFLPPDPAQRPSLDLIRLANQFRKISV